MGKKDSGENLGWGGGASTHYLESLKIILILASIHNKEKDCGSNS